MTPSTGRIKDFSRRTAAALAVVITAGIGAAVINAAPAFAASTGPVALGLGKDSDTRVLAVSGTTSGTAVVAVPYTVGVSGEAVLKQRWTLEMTVYVEDEITVGYRFKNAQTGLCLTKSGSTVNNAPVTATTCGTAVAQLWDVPVEAPNAGVQLRSFVDYRCLDLAGGSTAANAPARVSTCNSDSTAWYQRWKLRYGTFSCERLSNQRILTGLCVNTGAAPMYGAFATWRNNPVSYTAQAPTTPNGLDNFLEVRSQNAANEDAQPDGVEFGLHQEYAQNASVVSPYWIEWGAASQEYHSIGGTEGGNAADGRNHTYMIVPATGNKQWDVLYDFNLVGTSRMQEGAQLRDVFANLSVVNPNTVTTAEPFQHRVQLIDGNGRWRRPYLGEVSRSEPKTCNALITDADPLWDLFNTPPNCMTTSLVARTASNPVDVDYMSVGVPRVGSALAPPQKQPVRTSVGAVGGVDQNALRTCMETSPQSCLATVPHLQDCVSARRECSSPPTSAMSARTRMTSAEARTIAARRLGTLSPDTQVASRSFSSLSADLRAQAPSIAGSAAVHVVTGTSTVPGLGNADQHTYSGYTMIFDATSAVLLYACLGRECPRTDS